MRSGQQRGSLPARLGLALVIACAWPGVAMAAQYWWWEGAPSGYWDETNSWNPPVVPGAGSVAFVHSRYGGVLTPLYRSATSPLLLAIEADTPSGDGSVSFTQARDTLKCETVTVGVFGDASWVQSGGLAEFDLLRLGEWSSSVGTFRLQGTGQLVSGTTDIGSAGLGYFYLSGSALHAAGRLWIADGSRYTVEGGTLSADDLIVDADYLQTNGQVSVGGELKVQLGLSAPAGKADLRGGRLTAGTLSVPFGTFEQTGGELNAGTSTNGGGSLFNIGAGTFSAGPFTNHGFFGQSGGNATLKALFTNSATGTFQQSGGVSSSTKLVNDSTHMTLMGTAECRARTLENNGTASLQSGLLRGTEAMPGLFWTCQFANAGTFTMSGGEFRGELTNTGTFSYIAGDFSKSQLINNGTFSRTVPFSCYRLVNHATVTADSTNPITASATNYAGAIENSGTLTVSGTALTVTGTKPVVNSGTLRGSGTIVADVDNSGIVTVGTSPIAASLEIQGDYTQQAAGELRLTAFEGLGVGAMNDRLAVNGHAKLGGALTVSGQLYTPNAGDRLRVVTFASSTGEFTTWTLPASSPGLVWMRERTATSLALVARAPMAQDFDRDGDVDSTDLETFEICASGPAVPCQPGCLDKDLDADGDVDQSDFGLLQRCYSGANRPVDLTCDD